MNPEAAPPFVEPNSESPLRVRFLVWESAEPYRCARDRLTLLIDHSTIEIIHNHKRSLAVRAVRPDRSRRRHVRQGRIARAHHQGEYQRAADRKAASSGLVHLMPYRLCGGAELAEGTEVPGTHGGTEKRRTLI